VGPEIDAMKGIAKASKNRSLADFQAVSVLVLPTFIFFLYDSINF